MFGFGKEDKNPEHGFDLLKQLQETGGGKAASEFLMGLSDDDLDDVHYAVHQSIETMPLVGLMRGGPDMFESKEYRVACHTLVSMHTAIKVATVARKSGEDFDKVYADEEIQRAIATTSKLDLSAMLMVPPENVEIVFSDEQLTQEQLHNGEGLMSFKSREEQQAAVKDAGLTSVEVPEPSPSPQRVDAVLSRLLTDGNKKKEKALPA